MVLIVGLDDLLREEEMIDKKKRKCRLGPWQPNI